MGKKAKIIGTLIVTVMFLIIWNAAIAPALTAPYKKDMAICDQKMALADQRALALDHNDQLKYDELTAQYDSIKGC